MGLRKTGVGRIATWVLPGVGFSTRPGTLDGKLHSVKMAAQEIVTGNDMRFAAAQLYLH